MKEPIDKLELSIFDKLKIYRHALEQMKANTNNDSAMALCWTLTESATDLGFCSFDDNIAYYVAMKHNFPEVYKYKPLKRDWYNCSYWFPRSPLGMQKRMAILQKVITKLEKLDVKCNLSLRESV